MLLSIFPEMNGFIVVVKHFYAPVLTQVWHENIFLFFSYFLLHSVIRTISTQIILLMIHFLDIIISLMQMHHLRMQRLSHFSLITRFDKLFAINFWSCLWQVYLMHNDANLFSLYCVEKLIVCKHQLCGCSYLIMYISFQ